MSEVINLSFNDFHTRVEARPHEKTSERDRGRRETEDEIRFNCDLEGKFLTEGEQEKKWREKEKHLQKPAKTHFLHKEKKKHEISFVKEKLFERRCSVSEKILTIGLHMFWCRWCSFYFFVTYDDRYA